MLGNENGVAAHGRLFSVLRRESRSKPIPDECRAMLHDGIKPTAFQILLRLFIEVEPGTEPGFLKSQEKLFGRRNAQDGSTF